MRCKKALSAILSFVMVRVVGADIAVEIYDYATQQLLYSEQDTLSYVGAGVLANGVVELVNAEKTDAGYRYTIEITPTSRVTTMRQYC